MRILPILLAALVLPGITAHAQESRLSEGCDLALFGGWDRDGFVAFDEDLRSALVREDIAALSLLVRFPLRVNAQGGTFLLGSPSSLQSRFEEVFPPSVRSAVLYQERERLHCNWSGLQYGNGRVWVGVSGHRYAVTSINLPRTAAANAQGPRVVFACDAENHRFLVLSDESMEKRLKGWTKPRRLAEEPDTLASGVVRYEGTGLCAYRVWTFESGERTYVLNTLGCTSETDSPPQDATGAVSISDPGAQRSHYWCY